MHTINKCNVPILLKYKDTLHYIMMFYYFFQNFQVDIQAIIQYNIL